MSVQLALDNFGKRVVKESKTALTKKKKNASRGLYNSISYNAKESKNSFELSFSMKDYGKFIDKGVKGAGGVKANGNPWKRKKVTNNLYKYTTKRPPAKVFNSWIVKRGIAPRNKKGQFTSRKGLAIAIANSVFHTGLETTNFFTKPFESAFKDLPNEIMKAYGLEVEKLLNSTLK